MAIYVIGDLHLSTNQATNKSMEKFGKRWLGYTEKLRKNWEAVVTPADTVVIPGDISWAMKLEEALSDFQFMESLPGTKLIGKGNHDFWWTTASKMNTFFEENHISSVKILNNNAYFVEDQVLCGTRGWFLDEKQQVTVGSVDYEKIVNREVIRLKLSLDSAVALQKECEEQKGFKPPISVFLHFPPVWLDFICRPFVDALHEYGDPACYFGHIHGMYNAPKEFSYEGIPMRLVSSDAMDFTLYRLPPVGIFTEAEDLC
ncbi:MAG: metallophosphoesterase [Clostridia bacterium]|nr:metallophosphoesterase [Clostridia bacterium]